VTGLQAAALAALIDGPLSGRSLQLRMESRVGHRLSYGSLSRVIAQLEADDALIVTDRTYELTPRGREMLSGGDNG
jgi:DNA-binding PadR family transcriptional regulator